MKSGDHQFDPGREQYILVDYFPFLKKRPWVHCLFKWLGLILVSLRFALKFAWVCNRFS